MKTHTVINNKVTLLILSVLASSGCAIIPAHQVPIVQSFPQLDTNQRPTVLIQAKYRMQIPGVATNNFYDYDNFKILVAKTIKKSDLFRKYGFSKATTTNANYQIVLRMRRDTRGETLCNVISILSVTLIPSTMKDIYILEGALLNSKGQILKTYRYEDSARSWVHLTLLPFIFFRPPWTVCDNIQVNLVNCFLRDVASEFMQDQSHDSHQD